MPRTSLSPKKLASAPRRARFVDGRHLKEVPEHNQRRTDVLLDHAHGDTEFPCYLGVTQALETVHDKRAPRALWQLRKRPQHQVDRFVVRSVLLRIVVADEFDNIDRNALALAFRV